MEITQREAKLLESHQGCHCLKLLQGKYNDEHRLDIMSDAVFNLMELGLKKRTIEGVLERVSPSDTDAGIVDDASRVFARENKDELNYFVDNIDKYLFNQQEVSVVGPYIEEIPTPTATYSLTGFSLIAPSQVTIITAPIGSGKTTATAETISKVMRDKSTPMGNILIICPRNKSCDQFADLLEMKKVDAHRCYGSYKEKINYYVGVTVTNFDNAPKLLYRTHFDWIIVDDFHALWDDSTFRRSQNERLTQALLSIMSRASVDLYFISATPRKEVLIPFFNNSAGEVKSYSYILPRETRQVNFYRTKDVNASIIQLILDSDVRCIVHSNNIVVNAKIAVYLAERGKSVLQTHSGTKDSFKNISDYDCILVTNFIDSGFSIDDGVPSKVFTIASASEGIIPLVQHLGRTRENVEEYAVILKKRKYRKDSLRQMDNMQTWNCGWDFDQCDVPMNWSYGKKKRGDYLERSATLGRSIWEGNYLNKILEVSMLKDLYNDSYAKSIGFAIGEIYDLESQLIDLDIFVREVREVFLELSCECDVLTLLTSLIRVAPNRNDVPESINRLCACVQAQGQFNGEVVNKISQRLLQKFGSRLIVSDAYKEIIQLCVGILSIHSLDDETLKGLEVPLTVEEWFSSSPNERHKYLQKCQQALASLFAIADADSPRPHKMDPIHFNVGKIFNRWIKHVVESGETSFTPKDLEAFVNRFICQGYLAMHSNKYFANLGFIDRGKIYQCFKTSVKWICRREKIGVNVYFNIDATLLENFIILLKSLGVMWERLTEEQFNLPRYLKYDNNLRQSVILCHPLYQLVCGLV